MQTDKLYESVSCPSLFDYGKLSVKGIVSRDKNPGLTEHSPGVS